MWNVAAFVQGIYRSTRLVERPSILKGEDAPGRSKAGERMGSHCWFTLGVLAFIGRAVCAAAPGM